MEGLLFCGVCELSSIRTQQWQQYQKTKFWDIFQEVRVQLDKVGVYRNFSRTFPTHFRLFQFPNARLQSGNVDSCSIERLLQTNDATGLLNHGRLLVMLNQFSQRVKAVTSSYIVLTVFAAMQSRDWLHASFPLTNTLLRTYLRYMRTWDTRFSSFSFSELSHDRTERT